MGVEPFEDANGEAPACWLCARPLGERVDYHHPVPKIRKGRDVVAVHPICHQTLHATFTNRELERIGTDATRLRDHPDIAKFLSWIEHKPPDFHAPTRRKQ